MNGLNNLLVITMDVATYIDDEDIGSTDQIAHDLAKKIEKMGYRVYLGSHEVDQV